jgi:hypothetical protein
VHEFSFNCVVQTFWKTFFDDYIVTCSSLPTLPPSPFDYEMKHMFIKTNNLQQS